MQYRRFGRTELQMPVFSCGGMRYQHSWQDLPLGEIPAANQANLEATIRRALEVGIHHIETARGYGTSELQLGQVLPGLPRDRLIVQTKVSPQENPEDFRRTLTQSLANLGLDQVDLLGIHG
ncbi:MAG: aldo/keto reductase, partial [Cyanobacteriota bacterium]|nr:aldo/keto reductase [Cyanobacteriota bacterium]